MRPPADAAGNTRPQADLWWAMRASADVYKGQCEGNAGIAHILAVQGIHRGNVRAMLGSAGDSQGVKRLAWSPPAPVLKRLYLQIVLKRSA